MPIPFDVADRIFCAEKRLLRPLKWETVESKKRNEQRRRLECRVSLSEGVPRGVFFRVTMFPRSLVRATFQLECDASSGRAHVPLYRLEVDPRGQHMNKPYGPAEINGVLFPPGQTHEHVFYDSLTSAGELRDGRSSQSACEQARIVESPPGDFATALAMVCSRINIINGDEVPSPGDQGMLL